MQLLLSRLALLLRMQSNDLIVEKKSFEMSNYITAAGDVLVDETSKAIAANGTAVETAKLVGPNEHLNGVVAIVQAKNKIGAFLNR